MNLEDRRKVEQNIFAHALPSVEPWEKFKWHYDSNGKCDSWKQHSSQALAISVFGFLRVAPQAERDLVMDSLVEKLGLAKGGPWEIKLEWTDDDNLLKEKRKSQIDAIATSPHNQIFFECKFTEKDGGSCSQAQRRRREVQCNGNYEEQTNPINNTKAKCALSGKGIRYWEIIPQIFGYDASSDHRPCPFAGPWYQWMRNLTQCYETAKAKNVSPAFVIVYADSPHFAVSTKNWSDFTNQLRKDTVSFDTISYQALLELACEAIADAKLHAPLWQELRLWVGERIRDVESDQRK